MKQFIKTLLLFSILLGCVALSAPSPIIAILDSPVDYEHPQIQAVLDEDLLKNVKILDENGQEKSWYDLNIEAKAEFERRLNRNYYAEQVEYLDSLGKKNNTSLSTMIKGTLRYIFFPKFRSGLNVVADYLHGAHVAGIAMKSLSSARLITFPHITAPEAKFKLSEILEYSPIKYRESLRHYFSQISQVLQQENIRVVNLSIGTSQAMALKKFKQRATLLQKIFYSKNLKEMAIQGAKNFSEELGSFIRANPNSVFVLAAGNESKDLGYTTDNLANIKAENLVKVSATNDLGALAGLSNYSASNVDIAAPGIRIASARVGGGNVHMSGTSFAAPAVTNALAEILELTPTLSTRELIETLYSKYSFSDSFLTHSVAKGRVLKNKPMCSALFQN
ncbi:MAG: S8 family serine peptidase [Pseudomonadota bacterium]|nr:S8 family serine peptidase [Pseudomonadota bacterium]